MMWSSIDWNGKGWYGAESANHGNCTEMDLLGGGWSHNNYHWRGLTHNAKVSRGAEASEESAAGPTSARPLG